MRLLPLLALMGCLNTRRFLAPEEFVTAPDRDPEAPLVEVRYASGWHEEAVRDFDPAPVPGTDFVRPVWISNGGWIEVTPRSEAPMVRVFARHTGDLQQGFTELVDATGAVPGRVVNEVRFLEAAPLQGPMRLSLDDLHNVYNDYTLVDGDLLMLEVADGDAVEHYLFRNRRFGLRTKFGAGVLFRVPLPRPSQRADQVSLSPALAASFGLGYRFRTRRPVVTWLSERTTVLMTLGVGSTAVDQVVPNAATPVEKQVSGAFNAALAGGGLEGFGFVSLQLLANVSALTRERAESDWALALGFDAVAFGVFTRDAGARLFSKNALSEKD